MQQFVKWPCVTGLIDIARINSKTTLRTGTEVNCLGPATSCNAAHPRWDILIHLRCCKITCDGLRCIFQHVGNFAPDFRISQLNIVRFSNGLQHSDGYLTDFPVVCDLKLSVKYFLLPSQQWASQENIETFHHE